MSSVSNCPVVLVYNKVQGNEHREMNIAADSMAIAF